MVLRLKNKGVRLLLNAIVNYLPSPIDVPPIGGYDPDNEEECVREADDNAPSALWHLKLSATLMWGNLHSSAFIPVALKAVPMYTIPLRGKKERVGRLLQMHADKREDIEECYAGDILAAVGLKFTTTGETLCDYDQPVVLESMDFPGTGHRHCHRAQKPLRMGKMSLALQKLAEEDPTFRVHTDTETGQTIISGMGELHLEIIVQPSFESSGSMPTWGNPQVAYRETFRRPAKANTKFARQSGGHGQYGHCVVEFEPQEPGKGFEFESKIVGGVVPKEFIPPLKPGLKKQWRTVLWPASRW